MCDFTSMTTCQVDLHVCRRAATLESLGRGKHRAHLAMRRVCHGSAVDGMVRSPIVSCFGHAWYTARRALDAGLHARVCLAAYMAAMSCCLRCADAYAWSTWKALLVTGFIACTGRDPGQDHPGQRAPHTDVLLQATQRASWQSRGHWRATAHKQSSRPSAG